jgi:hypothetical protein
MKRFLALFTITMFAFVLYTPQAFSQVQDQKITVNTSDLTPDQLAKIKLEQANAELQKKLETYGKWVGVGGEVGTAVKEGLTAVVDVADKFGKTDVGRFTLVMVAWKVIGRDIVKIILGLLFFATLTFILIYAFRRLALARKIIIENPGFLKYPKKYQVVETELDSDGVATVAIIFVILFLLGIWITYGIMF